MTLAKRLRRVACLMVVGLPMACAPVVKSDTEAVPVTRWDHRPEARQWTSATLAALKSEGVPLLASTPADVGAFCPSYGKAGQDRRAAFWAGLFSAIAKYESTWNPSATAPGGRYLGLMQIAPQTAQAAGCDLSAAGGLHDGSSNLTCAVRIAARRAPAPYGAEAMSKVLGDWGPMLNPAKRGEIAEWTRQQSYCTEEL